MKRAVEPRAPEEEGAPSDGDLLEHVVNLGARGPPTCGTCLLKSLGGLTGLTRACPSSLSRLGLTHSQVAATLAALEIGCRLARAAVPDRDPLLPTPRALARYIALRYGTSGQEVMGALFLSAKGDVVGEEWLFRGTLHRCAVEPGPILKRAMLYGPGLVLFHTHPSGDPAPSREDIAFTRRMAGACEVMGVRFVDHLVVAYGGAWVSLRQRGGW